MHQNGERLDKVDGLQVAADCGCETDVAHIMNEEYNVW